jgi:hypothetical protein
MIRFLLITLFLSQQLSKNDRVISIYTKNANGEFYQKQLKLLAVDQAGLKDRDLIIRKIVYSNATAAEFKRHRISSGFTITLTGKDKGEKFRSTEPVTVQRLYNIIDQMPMRKSEVKHQ